jgi:ATP-binding cassette, subfamily B, multidrug efflux pump
MVPYRVAAIAAPLLMALEVAMDLAQPRLLQNIVDIGIANNDLDTIMNTGLIMIFVAIIGMIGGVGCTVYATRAALNFGTDIRADLFRTVQRFSFSQLDRLQTGSLVTRLTNDVEQVQEAAAMFLRILVRAPLLVLGSLIMAVITSPKLSLLLVAIAPLLIIIFAVIMGRARSLFTAVQERLDRVNNVMLENLAGVRVVKAFVRSAFACERFRYDNEALMNTMIAAMTLVAGVMPMMMLLVSLGVAGVVWFGGIQVNAGELQVGQILAFINYLMQMLASLMMVGMLVMRVARADASAERVLDVLESEPEMHDPPSPVSLPAVAGSIEFQDVGFSYGSDGGRPVLRAVSFTCERGDTVGIIGSTGSGKSTLVSLIPRLYEVSEGRVLVDGVDVRDTTRGQLRHAVAIVMQETTLFSGSVRDNICYARPDASNDEVEDAAKLAQAHDFIAAFPDGYDTVLGQRGVNLSGGQKQRLALARALICRPSILIMDDCTSAVDAATEARILNALAHWSHQCTRMVITQRISSIMAADRILILDDGEIVGNGSHQQLLAESDIYREIVQSQMELQEVADV